MKRDIDEIKDVQKFSIQAINTKLKSTENDMKYSLENSISEQKKKIAEMLKSHEHKELNQFYDETSKKIEKISGKIEELRSMSVDIDDIGSRWVTERDLEKRLSKLSRKMDKALQVISDYNEEKYGFASQEKLKTVEENLIELKSELVLRQDIEQINDRLDTMEEKFMKRLDNLKTQFDALEKKISDVYSLKKDFVSKERFTNLRKEIRLLVEGLKEIQRIKKRLDREKANMKKKPKKRAKSKKEPGLLKKSADAVVDFFFEED